MKVIGVIPSRYASSRLPGKPLKDICGKPMLWWVYNEAKKVTLFDDVVIATDNVKIVEVCNKYNMNVMLTSDQHDTAISRVYEVSTRIDADYYCFLGGDEPLVEAKAVDEMIHIGLDNKEKIVQGITKIKTAPEVIDFSNIKIVKSSDNYILYTTRSPIPYPKGGLEYDYYKFVGMTLFAKDALKFYNDTPMSKLEKIEEVDILRFIEKHMKILTYEIYYYDVSVDTAKDLDFVRKLMEERLTK